MGQDVDVPTLRLQERQIGQRSLGAGDDNQVGIDGNNLTGRDEVQVDQLFVA